MTPEEQYAKAKEVKEKLREKYLWTKNEDGTLNTKNADPNVHGLGITREGEKLDGDYCISMSVLAYNKERDTYPTEMDGIKIKIRESPMPSTNW